MTFDFLLPKSKHFSEWVTWPSLSFWIGYKFIPKIKNLMRRFRVVFFSKKCSFEPKMSYFGPKQRGGDFFKTLGLSLLGIHCHLTLCIKSEEFNEWFLRDMDFFRWSLGCWSDFCTFFGEKYFWIQKFWDHGCL